MFNRGAQAAKHAKKAIVAVRASIFPDHPPAPPAQLVLLNLSVLFNWDETMLFLLFHRGLPSGIVRSTQTQSNSTGVAPEDGTGVLIREKQNPLGVLRASAVQ